MNGIFLGFDFGLKRIGVAIGHRLTGQARPLSTLQARQGEPNWEEVRRYLKTWQPEALIVGIPTKVDGSEQYTTPLAHHFADSLKQHFNYPVHLVDERFSTVEARAQLFEAGGYKHLKRTEVDSVAACIILEQWLNSIDV